MNTSIHRLYKASKADGDGLLEFHLRHIESMILCRAVGIESAILDYEDKAGPFIWGWVGDKIRRLKKPPRWIQYAEERIGVYVRHPTSDALIIESFTPRICADDAIMLLEWLKRFKKRESSLNLMDCWGCTIGSTAEYPVIHTYGRDLKYVIVQAVLILARQTK